MKRSKFFTAIIVAALLLSAGACKNSSNTNAKSEDTMGPLPTTGSYGTTSGNPDSVRDIGSARGTTPQTTSPDTNTGATTSNSHGTR